MASFFDSMKNQYQSGMAKIQQEYGTPGTPEFQEKIMNMALNYAPMGIAGIKLGPGTLAEPGVHYVDGPSWAEKLKKPLAIAGKPNIDDLRDLFDDSTNKVLRVLKDKDTQEIVAAWPDDLAMHEDVIKALNLDGKYSNEFLYPEHIGLNIKKSAKSFFENMSNKK